MCSDIQVYVNYVLFAILIIAVVMIVVKVIRGRKAEHFEVKIVTSGNQMTLNMSDGMPIPEQITKLTTFQTQVTAKLNELKKKSPLYLLNPVLAKDVKNYENAIQQIVNKIKSLNANIKAVIPLTAVPTETTPIVTSDVSQKIQVEGTITIGGKKMSYSGNINA